jgi:transcriptional regulator with XRE-family HTH domain
MNLTREKLLKSDEYWKVQLQNDLYGIIEEYMKKNNLTRAALAEKLKVSKGYVTQILNGEFDHKISKLIDLSLICDKVPLTFYVDADEFVKNDALGKVYEVFSVTRMKHVTYEYKNPQPSEKVATKFSFDFEQKVAPTV